MPLSSSVTTLQLYPTWLLYQLLGRPVPGISVVPAMASCHQDETLPEEQDSKTHVCRVQPALPFPLESILHFIHVLSHPTYRNLTLSSFLATSRTPVTALSFVLPSHTSHPRRTILVQQSLRIVSFSPATENVSDSSTPALPNLLRPDCEDQGVGAVTITIGASLAKDAPASWQWVHLWCMWYVPSSTLWWHWEWASLQSLWQHQQTSFSSLHLLFLLTLLPFWGAWEVLLSRGRVTLKFHTGGVLPRYHVVAALQIPAWNLPLLACWQEVLWWAGFWCIYITAVTMPSIFQHHFLYPLAALPRLQGFWENGHFSSPGLISLPSPGVLPQKRLATSRPPTAKDCRTMPSPRTCYGLACCGSKPCWGMCWQLNSAEPWLWFV